MKKFSTIIRNIPFIWTMLGTGLAPAQQSESEPDTTTIPLSEVIITENRLQLPFIQQNRHIQIIDRKQIDALPARSVNELLSHVAGVDLRQRGPFGTQADVSIDGGSFEQTLVLVNGMKVLDAQTGHNTLNLPIPTDAIERIEIIRGPAARVYGINSLTGAINIVTRKPTASGVQVHAYTGSGFKRDTAAADHVLFHGRGVQLGSNLVKEHHRHSLHGSHESGNGYRYNTAFRNNKLLYQGEVRANTTDALSLMGGYVSNNFGANGFYAAPGDKESQEIVQTVLAALSYRSQLTERISVSPRVSYRYAYDDYRYFRNDLSRARSQHHGQAINTEINGTMQTSAGDIGIGLEMRNEIIRSTNIGNHNRSNYGLYAEFKTARIHDKLLLSAGTYINYNSDYGWQLFPGIDVGYTLNNRLKLVAHTGTGQRIPSFTDLYLNQPGNVGNPSLLSERAWHAEGGLKYVDNRLVAQATYFYRNMNEFIDWVRGNLDQPWQPQNFQRNRTRGVTFSGNYRLVANERRTTLLAGLSYTWLSPDIVNNQEAGYLYKYVIESLRHQLAAHVNWHAGPISATVAARLNERLSYKSYFLGDVRVAYGFGTLDIYLDTQNIFDVTYIEAAAIPMPGRWFSLGMKYRL